MDLKLAFSEFYLSLILLQNYQNLNFTGFRKILKKHDKLMRNDAGARWVPSCKLLFLLTINMESTYIGDLHMRLKLNFEIFTTYRNGNAIS